MRVGAILLILIAQGTGLAARGETSAASSHVDCKDRSSITLEAKNAPVEQLLKNLGDCLHFEVAYAEPFDKSIVVTGKFSGEIGDVLTRALRGMSFITIYDGSTIKRIVVTSSKGSPPAVAHPSSPAQPTATTASSDSGASPVTSSGDTSPSAPPSALTTLMQSQAALFQPGASAGTSNAGSVARAALDPNASASAADTGSTVDDSQQSLGALTQQAQQNIHDLINALQKACIGSNCPR
jgi:hypothetical protein